MRTVYLYEEIFTRKEFAIEVPDEVSDAQAEEWAIDEVMYNLSGNMRQEEKSCCETSS